MTHATETTERTPASTASPLATLVAIDSSDAAQRAIRLAATLESAGLIAPEAIAIDPIDLTVAGGARLDTARAIEAWLGPDALEAWRHTVKTDLRRANADAWPIRLRGGTSVPAVIAQEVKARRFGLVIVGLRHRGVVAQTTRRDTAWRIIEHLDTPVLAVAPGLGHVPRRVVVGIDFSRASERAVETAARLLDIGGTLTLTYAEPMPGRRTEDTEGYARIHEEGCEALLAKLARHLTLPDGARVQIVRKVGTPLEVLRETAKRYSADLIAVGRQSHEPFTRAVLGSVSADLIHDGHWSVLVTPPSRTSET